LTLEAIALKCSLRVAGCPALVEHKEWVFQGRLELYLHQHSESSRVYMKKEHKKNKKKKKEENSTGARASVVP
jgi:hypothetical protein